MLKSNENTLKDVLKQLIEVYKLGDGLTHRKVIGLWDQIAGEYVANHTEKVYIRNRKLFVKLNSPALKHELSFAKSKLLSALNKEAGENILDEIVFL